MYAAGFLAAAYLLGGFASSGPFAGLEKARRPPSIETLWLGLPKPVARAGAATGIVALKEPLERRVRIPGGRFVMGSTPQEMQDALAFCSKEARIECQRSDDAFGTELLVRAEGYAHDVTVSDFEIDATEVTVERYLRCVAAGGCAPPSFPAGDPRYDVASFPITHVTWQDAANYCSWAGGRLPTEAEWELAARGFGNRMFPWGNVYSPRLANHGSFADERTPARTTTDGSDGFIGLAPVGSFPDGATPTALFDMAGNASEWVADWYDLDEQRFGYPRGAQTNPKGPPSSALGHVVRGGSYLDGAHWMRTAARRPGRFAEREVGFRCAASL